MRRIFKWLKKLKSTKKVEERKIIGRDPQTNRPIYEQEQPSRLSMFDYTPNEQLRR